MKGDPEIGAINTCYEILNGLPAPARKRVVNWLAERFGSATEQSSTTTKENEPARAEAEGNGAGEVEAGKSLADEDSSQEFATAFSKAKPKTAADKVLFTAWYLSEKMGVKDLTSLRINKMLTHLGHKPTNASAEVRRLIAGKPALMIQMRKQGKSKQARKLLRVSEEGKEAARKMLEAPLANGTE